MSNHMCTCMAIMSIHIFYDACASVHTSVHMSIHMSIQMFIYMSMNMSMHVYEVFHHLPLQIELDSRLHATIAQMQMQLDVRQA